MSKKIVLLLICLLFFSTFTGIISSKKMVRAVEPILGYTHTVFVEIGTSQNCKSCDSWSQNIYDTYNSGDYDFHFVEMIIYDHDGGDLNEEVNNWMDNYSILAIPNSIFDGDYKRVIGNYPILLPNALNDCGNRAVADITADMMVSWLGDATIQVDITIENNKETQYNGHIRAAITEIISRYDSYYNNPFHFGFLDYAFNKEITIDAGSVYTDSTIWNGNEHQDKHGDDFGDIVPENIQLTMGVLSNDDGYADETVIARIGENNPPDEPSNPSPTNNAQNIDIDADLSWDCSDPDGGSLKFDVYFGTTSSPPQVAWNHSEKSYDPGPMDYNTTYYWKIVAWDNHNLSTSGPIWIFNIREKGIENQAPKIKIIKPEKALYIKNSKIIQRFFRITKVFGSITIEAAATDEDSGIEKVEFYINGKFKGYDTSEPYTYGWRRKGFSVIRIFIIKVVAYDNEGRTSVDWKIVRKIF